MLSKTIDGLFIGMRYGVWVLGVLGIVASLILAFANITLGFSSVVTCVGMLCLSVAVASGLLPKQLVKGKFLENNRFKLSIVTGIIAVVIMGIVYYTCGGFPEMNLLFI